MVGGVSGEEDGGHRGLSLIRPWQMCSLWSRPLTVATMAGVGQVATMEGGYKATSLIRSRPWQVCAQRGDLLLKDAAILHYWAEKVRSPER